MMAGAHVRQAPKVWPTLAVWRGAKAERATLRVGDIMSEHDNPEAAGGAPERTDRPDRPLTRAATSALLAAKMEDLRFAWWNTGSAPPAPLAVPTQEHSAAVAAVLAQLVVIVRRARARLVKMLGAIPDELSEPKRFALKAMYLAHYDAALSAKPKKRGAAA